MNVFGFFKRRDTGASAGTAPMARERLKILLAHERSTVGNPDLVVVLREEILAAVTKHLSVKPDNVHVSMQCDDAMSTLTVDVEIPGPVDKLLAAAGASKGHRRRSRRSVSQTGATGASRAERSSAA